MPSSGLTKNEDRSGTDGEGESKESLLTACLNGNDDDDNDDDVLSALLPNILNIACHPISKNTHHDHIKHLIAFKAAGQQPASGFVHIYQVSEIGIFSASRWHRQASLVVILALTDWQRQFLLNSKRGRAVCHYHVFSNFYSIMLNRHFLQRFFFILIFFSPIIIIDDSLFEVVGILIISIISMIIF